MGWWTHISGGLLSLMIEVFDLYLRYLRETSKMITTNRTTIRATNPITIPIIAPALNCGVLSVSNVIINVRLVRSSGHSGLLGLAIITGQVLLMRSPALCTMMLGVSLFHRSIKEKIMRAEIVSLLLRTALYVTWFGEVSKQRINGLEIREVLKPHWQSSSTPWENSLVMSLVLAAVSDCVYAPQLELTMSRSWMWRAAINIIIRTLTKIYI